MFAATSHTDFNTHFNAAAGTSGVAYSGPWDMRTTSGKEYMHRNHMEAGKKLAGAILNGTAAGASRLHNGQNVDTLTREQKATLTVMRDSSTDAEFKSGMRGAVRSNALTNAAMHVFSSDNSVDASTLVLDRTLLQEKQEALAPKATSMQVESDQPADAQTLNAVDQAKMPEEPQMHAVDEAEPYQRQPHLADQAELGTLRLKKKRKK